MKAATAVATRAASNTYALDPHPEVRAISAFTRVFDAP
jgi:hypothetical protein